MSAPRLDKYLWAIRVFKTRSLATTACRGGHVRVNGQLAKPSYNVCVGDELRVVKDAYERILRVRALLDKRVGARLVPDFADDLTPPEEKSVSPMDRRLGFRRKGLGRPTKKERRELEAFLGEMAPPDERLGEDDAAEPTETPAP